MNEYSHPLTTADQQVRPYYERSHTSRAHRRPHAATFHSLRPSMMLSRILFVIALHARMAMAFAYPSGSGSGDDYYGSGVGWTGCGVNFDTYCELYNWPQCGISDIKRREIASDRLRRTKCLCIDENLCYTLHGEAMSRVCQERGETAGVCSTVRVNFSSNQLPWIN